MITLQELQEFLPLNNKNKTSLEDYPDVQIILNSTIAALENYTGRKLIETDLFNEKFWLYPDDNEINLKHIPVKKITEIKVDGVIYTGEYKVTKYGVKINTNTENDSQLIEVKGFGGFDEIPEDIKRAVFLQVRYEYQRKNLLGANSVSEGGSSVSYPEFQLLKEVKRLLRQYRHRSKIGI